MLNVAVQNINRLHGLFKKATGVGETEFYSVFYTVQTIKETVESKC